MVNGEPDGAPPVGVAAVDRCRRLRGLVVDSVLLPVDIDLVRRSFEPLRHGSQAVGREHGVLAQHFQEHTAQAIGIDHREQSLVARLVAAQLQEARAVLVVVGLLPDPSSA